MVSQIRKYDVILHIYEIKSCIWNHMKSYFIYMKSSHVYEIIRIYESQVCKYDGIVPTYDIIDIWFHGFATMISYMHGSIWYHDSIYPDMISYWTIRNHTKIWHHIQVWQYEIICSRDLLCLNKLSSQTVRMVQWIYVLITEIKIIKSSSVSVVTVI